MRKEDVTTLSYAITGCAITVHKTIGPGLLESVYERCLEYELIKNGFSVIRQHPIKIVYDNLEFDHNLKVDLFVNGLIVIELKTVDSLLPIHEAQVLTYMKLLKCPQGLLINFNAVNISRSMRPFVNKFYEFEI
ncbi:GxxExxY protein [Flavobacterium sp. D33]|nr:GxxExxY protein [Flavobacterium selenitireducens]MBD3583114.1 GxxExxY protein [Flavobacterium selenitireducens]